MTCIYFDKVVTIVTLLIVAMYFSIIYIAIKPFSKPVNHYAKPQPPRRTTKQKRY